MSPYKHKVDAIRGALDLDTARLEQAMILVIGLGGIGSILAKYLGIFVSSLEESMTVMLVDGDSFEDDNTYRMFVPTFGNKALVMDHVLSDMCNRTGLYFDHRPEYLTDENIEDIINPDDNPIVFCCVDNHATRNLVSKRVASLDDVTLISGGNDGVEGDETGTYGNVQVHIREAGRDITVPITKFHPEIANPQDQRPDELDCMEAMVSGAPQLLFANLAVASAMLNAFLRTLSNNKPYDEACVDILEAKMNPVYY